MPSFLFSEFTGTVPPSAPGIDTSAFHNGGDARGALQFFGTNDAFNVNVERGGITQYAIDADGLTFVADKRIAMTESAAVPGSLVAGEGRLWVRNLVPNLLYFTDDAGTDHAIIQDGKQTTGADIDVGLSDGSFKFHISTADTRRLTVDRSGNLGLNTESPISVVELRPPIDSAKMTVRIRSTLESVNPSAVELQFAGETGTGANVIYGRIDSEQVVITNGAHEGALRFFTADGGGGVVEAMEINESQQVLIGTNTPTGAELLKVDGAALITGKLTVTGAIDPTSLTLSGGGTAHFIEYADGLTAPVSASGTGRITYNDTTKTFRQSLDGGAYAALGGTSFPLLAPDGAVGAPSYSFASDSTTGIFFDGAAGMALSAGGTEAMRVDSAGATVLIGLTSPVNSSPLEVKQAAGSTAATFTADGGAFPGVSLNVVQLINDNVADALNGINLDFVLNDTAPAFNVYGRIEVVSTVITAGSIEGSMKMIMPDGAGVDSIVGEFTTNRFNASLDAQIAGSGRSLGFYGTAPIAQQVGVAVTAAGIHAACVALGLFTA